MKLKTKTQFTRIGLSTLTTFALIACGGSKNKGSQEQETTSSMRTLKEQKMEDCPELTGTYSCLAEDNDGIKKTDGSMEDVGFIIKKISDQNFHFTQTDNNTPDFVSYMVEKYLLDDGGYIVNGKAQDKTEGVRQSLNGLINTLATPQASLMMTATGIDLESELKKINFDSLKAGYVSSCSKGKLNLHHIFAESAIKLSIQKNSDKSVTLTGHLLEDGKIKKHTETCQMISDKVKEKTLLTDKIKSDSLDALKKLNMSSPSELLFEVVNKSEVSLKEPIFLRFDRDGWFTRTDYKFDKSFLGPEDNFWGDDVSLKHSWSKISFSLNTMKVVGLLNNGQTEVIGDVLIQDNRYMINITAPHEIQGQTLVFKNK